MKSFAELRRGVSRSWDKHQLQQTISRGILLMEGHKQANLPTGHNLYKIIYGDINMAMQRYCKEYDVQLEAFSAGVPKLRELQALADGETTGMPAAAYPIAAFVLGIMVTIYLAGCHDLYMYLTHWVR